MQGLDPMEIRPMVRMALKEDMKTGDITTEAVVPKGLKARSTILAKEEGVVCGLPVAEQVFRTLDPKSKFKSLARDGNTVTRGQEIALVEGNARALLSGERVALNFLQRLSGIATTTHEYVELAKLYGVKILDTRKTTPGLRALEKYAVRCGGGQNHRIGLYDMVLIKDNHIKAAGSVAKALEKTKALQKRGLKVEVEVEALSQVENALKLKPDIIMLDNMFPRDMELAVRMIAGKAKVEASGGITLSNVEAAAKTGVDFISVGSLTHSYKSLDISMEMEV